MAIDQLFFELLRVAIGTQDRLSRPPLGEEWRQLYDMAKKQSLVGILKGQGVGQLYAEHLRGLRQSGDIDVWVQNKSIPELVEYVKGLGVGYTATAAHVECEMFDGTDVELHAEPAFFRSFRNDRKLKRWFQEVSSGSKFQVVSSTIESLGMKKFASGILWVIDYVFGGIKPYETAQGAMKPSKTIPLSPDEKVGKLLLDEIMQGGNFGHHDEKNKGLHSDSAVGRSLIGLKRNMKFFALGPWEILGSPLWSIWHYVWRKRRGYL